ncbi:MAG: hypothetical protein AB7D06_14465 [Pedobacter sp.]
MSEWLNSFENHQIHAQIQQIKDLLEQVGKHAEKQSDALEDYNRLTQIILFVANALSSTDPLMAPKPTLQNLSNHSQNIIQELSNYNANQNRGHLVNANNQADHLLVQGRMLFSVTQVTDIDGLRDSIGNFRKSAGQYIRYLEEDFNNLKSKIEELTAKATATTNEINSQKGRLDTAISQFQQQFSDAAEKRREQFAEAEKQRNDEHTAALESHEQKIDELVSQNNENFSSFLKKVEESANLKIAKISERINEIDGRAEKISNQLQEETKKQIESFKTDAESILNELQQKKEEASNLVQIIGNIGVTGNFQRIANQEKETADWLRKVALFLMTGMVLVIGLTIFISAQNGFDWKLSLFRLGAALVLAVPATYAASESSKHRNSEYRNRQAELELASIDPYLEKMPDITKHELKAKLTERFFGNNHAADIATKEKVTSSSLFDLIKLTIENLTKK